MEEQFGKRCTLKPFLDINGDIQNSKRAIPYIDLCYRVHVNEDSSATNDRESRSGTGDRPFETDLRGILTAPDRIVVITGISGIGKSSMINQLIEKWCKDEVWRDEPKIDIIFNIKGSTLDTLYFGNTGSDNRTAATEENIFMSLFPNVFKTTSIDIMKKFKNKLLVVDGLDELQDRSGDCHRIMNTSNPLIYVQKFILQTETFGFDRIIITSNSRAIASLRKVVNESILEVKFVEVLGFSKENSDKYLNNVRETSPPFGNSLSNDLSTMLCVPAYLSIYASLTAGEDSRNGLNLTPRSNTELLLYSVLAFYRKHSRSVPDDLSMNEIIDDDRFIEFMKHLSQIAFKRASKNSTGIPNISINSIGTASHDESNSLSNWNGIIKMLKQGEYGTTVYEFNHSIMEKLFCSLYLFQKSLGERQSLLCRDSFQQCWSYSVEIERLFEDSESCPILKKLLLRMCDDTVENTGSLRFQLSDEIRQLPLITLKDIDNEFKLFSDMYLPCIDENALRHLMSRLVVDFLVIDKSKWKKMKGILHHLLSLSKESIHSFYCDFSIMSDEIELCASLLFWAQNIHFPLEQITNPQVEHIIGSCLGVLVGFFRGEENRLLNTLTSKEKIYITNPKWYYSPWRFTPDVCGNLPDGLFQYLPYINYLTLRGVEGVHIDQIVAASVHAQTLVLEECSLGKDSTVFCHNFMRIEIVTLKMTKLLFSHLSTVSTVDKMLNYDKLEDRSTRARGERVNGLKYLTLHYCQLDWQTLKLLLEIITATGSFAIESIDILNYRSLEATGIEWIKNIARFYQSHQKDLLPRYLSIKDRYGGVDLTLQLRYENQHGKFDVTFLFEKYDKHVEIFRNTYGTEIMHDYAFCWQILFGFK